MSDLCVFEFEFPTPLPCTIDSPKFLFDIPECSSRKLCSDPEDDRDSGLGDSPPPSPGIESDPSSGTHLEISYLLQRFVSDGPPPFDETASPSLSDKFHHSGAASRVRPSIASTFSATCRDTSATPRFHVKLWRWLRSKTRSPASADRHRRRRMSDEQHVKRKYKVNDEHPLADVRVLLKKKAVESGSLSPKFVQKVESWADMSVAGGVSDRSSPAISVSSTPARSPRALLLPPPHAPPAPAAAPPVALKDREFSLESGYLSHSPLSTPSTPKYVICHGRRPMLPSKSVCSGDSPTCVRSQARSFKYWRSEDNSSVDFRSEEPASATDKRKQFKESNPVFHEEVEEENCSFEVEPFTLSSVRSCLGEWCIKHEELTFGKLLADGGRFGRDIHLGRWHGDVVIHSFRIQGQEDVSEYLGYVKALTHIRHENIVMYMGASLEPDCYRIITNTIAKSETLFARLRQSLPLVADRLDIQAKIGIANRIANAMGYLHAKGIVHGNLSSKNVFLERKKVQLSLLDYGVGARQLSYCSPQLLSEKDCYRGKAKTDDVFAFGTLLFELFSHSFPLAGDSDDVIAAKIRAGYLPRTLDVLRCTEKFKRLIGQCWMYEADRRISFKAMGPHFQPGLLLRRFSSSDSHLDQINSAAANAAQGNSEQQAVAVTIEGITL